MQISLRHWILALGLNLLLVSNTESKAQSATASALSAPPVAPIRAVVDQFYGTRVSDPYRYMENLIDPEVAAWFKGQNDYTRAALARIPGRAGLLARIRDLDHSVPSIFAARLPGNAYLIYRRDPGEDTAKLYVRVGLKGLDRLLVDPDKINLAPADRDKGRPEIGGTAVSDDGKLIVVGVTPGGSETNNELHVFEIATGRELPDLVAHGAGAEGQFANWLPDSHSFVYGRLQSLPPNAPSEQVRQNFRSYLHVLGTDPDKDAPVFGNGVVPSIDVDRSLIASVVIPRGSGYAVGILNGSVTPNSAYYVAPIETLGKAGTPWRKVADFADGVTDLTIQKNDLYLLTYKDAPRYKVLRLDARNPNLAAAEVVVPQGQHVVTGIARASDALYVQFMDGGISRLSRLNYGPVPKLEPVPLPADGSAFLDNDARLPGLLIFLSTWTKAFKVYEFDPKSKKVTDTGIQPVGPFDDPPNVESVEVKVPSHDGTLVPLSIVSRKGMKLDGSNPVLLEGYGGYSISITPYYSPTELAWFELGGVHAYCHVRGGGEYGEEWHLGGKGDTKPNTWLDFIACAQYLIDKKYSSSARLAGTGASAGGILIGRAITEKPDLFGAAVIDVGLLDTIRFETSANGETNIPELGTVKDENGFKNLYTMSAYAHVKDQIAYPAVLLTTGSNDPRVDPWMPGKMTARLQAATSSGKPILLRVDYGGGHGGGSGEAQRQEALADRFSFLLWQFGIPEFQPQP